MRCTRPSAPGEEAELNCEVLRLSASRVWGALPNGPIRYSGRWGLQYYARGPGVFGREIGATGRRALSGILASYTG